MRIAKTPLKGFACLPCHTFQNLLKSTPWHIPKETCQLLSHIRRPIYKQALLLVPPNYNQTDLVHSSAHSSGCNSQRKQSGETSNVTCVRRFSFSSLFGIYVLTVKWYKMKFWSDKPFLKNFIDNFWRGWDTRSYNISLVHKILLSSYFFFLWPPSSTTSTSNLMYTLINFRNSILNLMLSFPSFWPMLITMPGHLNLESYREWK